MSCIRRLLLLMSSFITEFAVFSVLYYQLPFSLGSDSVKTFCIQFSRKIMPEHRKRSYLLEAVPFIMISLNSFNSKTMSLLKVEMKEYWILSKM